MTTLDSQITKAREYLARFKTDTLGHFINGEWTLGSGEDTFENQSPINNKRLGTVVKGSAEDVNQACLAAQNAFEEWANFSGAKRRQILHKLADEIERRAEEIALVESVDCGQAFRFMKQAAVRGAANFRFFADKAPEAKNGDSLFQESHTNFTVRTPIGLWVSSHPGIHRSCSPRGKLRQHLPPVVPLFTSLRNSALSARLFSRNVRKQPDCQMVCGTW